MNPDLALTLGLLFIGLALPSVLGAWSSGRAPRLAMLLIVAGAGLFAYAVNNIPGGVQVDEIPDHIIRGIKAMMG